MDFFQDQIEVYSYADRDLYRITWHQQNGSKLMLDLTSRQKQLIDARFSRQFYKRCKEERVLSLIDHATNYQALEEIAVKYDFADVCDFSDLNHCAIKATLKAIVKILYRYPKLRSQFGFLGSCRSYKRAFARLANGDRTILKDFSLEYIFDEVTAPKVGKFMYEIACAIQPRKSEVLALAVRAYGVFNAVLLDEEDYEGYRYISLLSEIRRSSINGFHPEACTGPESIIYHEAGHMLDYLCGVSTADDFSYYFGCFSKQDIGYALSEYATKSPAEMVAEGFAEYMCNPMPRPLSALIGRIINDKYARLTF